MTAPAPAIEVEGGAIAFGDRTIWEGLDLRVEPGELLAVLGPNGSGKTSFVRVLLGLLPLSHGTCRIAGAPPRRGDPSIGYVPQQRRVDGGGLVRGRDFVGFGVDGHRFGPTGPGAGRHRRQLVDAALRAVDGERLGDRRLDRMSGGEQQRLRIAQALVGDPPVLLCDEPLLSLDLTRQRQVVELVQRRRTEHRTAVVFVTHELNPVLPHVDRVLYLVAGRCRTGRPEEVMTSEVLTGLYGSPIEVVEVGGRLVVVGAEDDAHHHEHDHDHAGGHP